jgi:transcriptional regulator with XRE-family HTH domain
MAFSETLRRVREEAGLTQAGLAQSSSVPLRTIQGWEQGYRCPVSPDFFRLVKALGVSADAFADSVLGEARGSRGKAKGQPNPRGRPLKATPATPPAEDLDAVKKTRKRKK